LQWLPSIFVFPDYCGFTCLKIIRCKKTCILAKVKFNHL
jgi:hypothetical protein